VSSASTVSPIQSFFVCVVHNVIILIVHLIFLLSYYSTLIALIRFKKKEYNET